MITWKIFRGGKWEQLVHGEDNFKIASAFQGRLLEISFVNQSTHQTKYRCEANNSESLRGPLVHEVELKVEGSWPKGEGKSLCHVALVVKFLDLNKPWSCYYGRKKTKEIGDQFRFVGNCPPTPPLSQH